MDTNQALPAAAHFDARLIPEFDGTADVVQWITRAEMLCRLRGVAVETVLPLRLSGGAFAVWAQLPPDSQSSLETVRAALYAAFALDEHAAYEAFSSRRLQPGESADVYLADLRRLAALFGGVPDRALGCAFVAGLPDQVRHSIRTGSRAEALDLAGVLARARAVLSDERVATVAAAAARGNVSARTERRDRGQRHQRGRRCWTCGSLQHLAADCQQGNDRGSGAAAPAPSPAQH